MKKLLSALRSFFKRRAERKSKQIVLEVDFRNSDLTKDNRWIVFREATKDHVLAKLKQACLDLDYTLTQKSKNKLKIVLYWVLDTNQLKSNGVRITYAYEKRGILESIDSKWFEKCGVLELSEFAITPLQNEKMENFIKGNSIEVPKENETKGI